MSNGVRVLTIVSLDGNLNSAIKKAYELIENVNFENIYFRKDIAQRKIK